MKLHLVVLLLGLLGVICDVRPKNQQQQYRLIQFNETTVKIMSQEQVEKLAAECGAGHHGSGFMDITEHPYLRPRDLMVDFDAIPTKLSHNEEVSKLISLIEPDYILEFNNALTKFHNRYFSTHSGVQAAKLIKSHLETLSASRSDISIQFFNHNFAQPSVIARIEGQGNNNDQTVIISAHLDSTAGGPEKEAPGADDDASGTSTVVEVFRVFAESGFVPNRALEFHLYAAEEVGLLGSQDVAALAQQENKKVHGQLQLDMTLYPGTPGNVGVITDYVDPDLTELLRQLIDAYTNLSWVNSECGYACSDHGSWTKAGYRSCFPFESPFDTSNPFIHSTSDIFSKLDLAHGTEFAKIAIGFMVELSLSN